MSIALQDALVNYLPLSKIFMNQLKTNLEIVTRAESTIELAVGFICRHFYWTFKSLTTCFDRSYLKLANFQLRIFSELQKMFPDSFQGFSSMITTLTEVQCCANEEILSDELTELVTKLQELLLSLRHSPSFYRDFFKPFTNASELKLNFCFDLCLATLELIADNGISLSTALPTEEDSNFALKIIQTMSECPQMIHQNPALYDQLTCGIKKLLLAENLGAANFQFLECAIIKKMLSNDFWPSFICFQVLQDFMGQLDDVADYLNFFVKLLRKIWNPSTSIATLPQLYVSRVVMFIVALHPHLLQQNDVDAGIISILTKELKHEASKSFEEAFEALVDAPSAGNYYETLLSMKTIGEANKSIKTFCEAVKIIETCDWRLHSSLVVTIMDVIASTDDARCKMLLMLKLNPALSSSRSKPLEVKLKLIDLLFSFLPFMDLKFGLTGLMAREFNKLLNDPDNDLIVKRAVLKEFEKNLHNEHLQELMKSINFDCDVQMMTEDEKLEILERSKHFKRQHECLSVVKMETSEAPTTDHSQRLQRILKYSEWLHTQQLTDTDRSMIRQISLNFEKNAER